MSVYYSERNIALTVAPKYRPMLPCLTVSGKHRWLVNREGKSAEYDRCVQCGLTRREARMPRPISLHEALQGG